jgi:hydroxypyruvate isomerase
MLSGKPSEGWRKVPRCQRCIYNSNHFPVEGNQPMPKLAANLHYLFDEVPFLDRFAMAAHAGFKAVEFQVPYDWPVEALVERLQHYALKMVLCDTKPGDWNAGERGIAALPGREQEFKRELETTVTYCRAMGCDCSFMQLLGSSNRERIDKLRKMFLSRTCAMPRNDWEKTALLP